MKEDKLFEILQEFDEASLQEKALFGIYDTYDEREVTVIRANSEGIQLYAMELLKIAIEAESLSESELPVKYRISNYENWVDKNSIIFLDEIEISNNSYEVADLPKENFFSKLFSWGCIISLIVIVVIFLIGIGTIFTFFTGK